MLPKRIPLGRLAAVAAACLVVLSAAETAPAAAAQEAASILQATGVRGGLVVHLGCGNGEFTAALRPAGSGAVLVAVFGTAYLFFQVRSCALRSPAARLPPPASVPVGRRFRFRVPHPRRLFALGHPPPIVSIYGFVPRLGTRSH